jgi:predicted RNase H-like nuclease (RuvC/YqgF family)
MAEQNELEALGSEIRKLRTELVDRAISNEQSTALVEVYKTEGERLRQQIRLLEASVPVEVRENAELKAKVERLRGFYDNHNATVAELKRAIESHHPGQPRCDQCLRAWREE